ncbi:SpaH/EbpB family LPXTG-anchored major pilin [Leucobacter chromiireducens]|uniref:SpaH/EbpB family LPXTG-anchored major pilin n=1 Tax=Leucobacter chromiireducens TaxID=283877 RepID=UPI003F7DEE2B
MSQNTAPRALRRGLAATAALAVGALGLFAGGSAAYAENIDTTADGSLTVHKFENPGGGTMNPDGTGTAPSSAPIDGVVFEYCTITGIDLFDGTNVGWDTVRAVTEAQLVGARTGTSLGSHTLSGCTELPATVGGIAQSGRMPLGAYVVREKSAPASVTKKSEPFIVTIPTPGINQGEGDGTWVYDVNLYPKNDVGDKPHKTIQDQPVNGYVLGSEVSYSISQQAPAVTGDTYTKFTITDTLDARLTGSKAPIVSVNGTPLAAGDYTTEWTTSGSPVQSTLTVQLTGALATLVAGDIVQVDFNATVTALGNGEIANQGLVNVNDLDLDGDGNPGTPTEQVWTRWGQVKMKKVDADATGTGLAGAKFRVWMSQKASDCRLDTDLVAVNGTDGSELVATSGADGSIVIPGLWIGDDELKGGTMNNGLTERCYVLEEIAAPNGFVLPKGDDAKTQVIVAPGEVTTVPVSNEIPNRQQGVPELPLTGAAGQTLMIAGGLALAGVAVGSVLIARRRQRSEA